MGESSPDAASYGLVETLLFVDHLLSLWWKIHGSSSLLIGLS